jgi:hypothetical protein|tara:strand:+ start:122 stop:313 length:192 start_codon:yes stop_codon:yes gene_type:complete
MIDEDRTYENEVSFNNDRLDIKQDRKNNEINISLDLESKIPKKLQKKEKINEVHVNNVSLFGD